MRLKRACRHRPVRERTRTGLGEAPSLTCGLAITPSLILFFLTPRLRQT
jgi:hypothetical protein